MSRGRRRKIEVPTGDTQSQFQLRDTAEDIERRGMRERREQEGRDRGEKRVRTHTDTDVESTQSRQKKGQMKSIFLSDSDEKAIVEYR